MIIHAAPLAQGGSKSEISLTQLCCLIIPAVIIAAAEVLTAVSSKKFNFLHPVCLRSNLL